MSWLQFAVLVIFLAAILWTNLSIASAVEEIRDKLGDIPEEEDEEGASADETTQSE